MESLQTAIDARLKELKETQRQSPSLPICSTQTQLTQAQEAGLRSFLLANSPAVQSDIAVNPYNCMFGNYPTLSQLRKDYGKNAPLAWLIPQLKDLSEFCGVKDKITTEQLQSLAKVITSEFGYLKTSEVMLFLHLMKSGRYGQFYGAIDPMKITTAIRTFLTDRNDYFYRLEQKRRERKQDEARQGAVTYEEYQRMLADGEIL